MSFFPESTEIENFVTVGRPLISLSAGISILDPAKFAELHHGVFPDAGGVDAAGVAIKIPTDNDGILG